MTGALVAWYQLHGRELPWRSTRDPWVILVVEVMSQQTQIGRVVEKIDVFLERFPTPESMADADVAQVLQAWSGLGFNRRAIRLREAAICIAGNGWPATSALLEGLPGVGPYTAAAVACFAFGEQVPAIDTNLRRVISRWEGVALDGAALVEAAKRHLPEGKAAEWNQAVMDLASTVCLPMPLCERCPISSGCRDPAVYQAPRSQGRFEGSARQARGAVLKALLDGRATTERLAGLTGISKPMIGRALAGLEADGMASPAGDGAWMVAVD